MGLTGLAWLFVSYGYVLYYASNLIGEGSELLLLVPSMAGLVGGVVLPLLGAVPDGGKSKEEQHGLYCIGGSGSFRVMQWNSLYLSDNGYPLLFHCTT